MSIKDRVFDFLFYMLVGTLYSFSLAVSFVTITVLEIPLSLLLGLCVLFLLAFYLLFFNKYTSVVVLAGLSIALFIMLFLLWRKEFQTEWFLYLRDRIGEIYLFLTNRIYYNESFNLPVAIGIAFMTGLFTFLNVRLSFRFYFLMLVGMGVLAIPISKGWDTSDLAVAIFAFCFMVFLLKKLNLYGRKKSGQREKLKNNGFSMLIIPACLVAFALVWFLPKPSVEGNALAEALKLDDVTISVVDMKDYDTVSIFEDRGELGGPISLSDRFIMWVGSYTEPIGHLSAIVRDTYVGNGWISSDKGKEKLLSLDGSYNIDQYSESQKTAQDNFYESSKEFTVTIDLGGKASKNIYKPTFSRELVMNEEGNTALLTNGDGQIWADKPIDGAGSYKVTYMNFKGHRGEHIKNYLRTFNTEPIGMERYLTVPEELSPKVAELAREITNGKETVYDKAIAIENYLLQFPYTLTPDPVPKGEDMIEYFLFTGQEGYCVYYASTFAMMARSVGIPTRYIEGFAIPPRQEPDGRYRITGASAHAWVEVYFEELGWVQFEPTASIGAEPSATDLEDIPDIPPEQETQPNPDGTDPTVVEPEVENPTDPSILDPDNTDPPKELFKIPTAVKVIGGIILVMGALFLGLRLQIQRYQEKLSKMEKLPPNPSVKAYFAQLLKVTKELKFPIHPTETVGDYAHRVAVDSHFDHIPIVEIAQIYDKATYSNDDITAEEQAVVKEGYQALAGVLKKEEPSDFTYYLNRYILHKF